ncbi:hypothetical protein [Streptomyces tendae]|uniref:hypothetical protein n=1 Tax=Streptomyces tendae TaxID=1932 RepID=UPI0036B5CF9D
MRVHLVHRQPQGLVRRPAVFPGAPADAVARRAEATGGVDRAHVRLPAGKKRSRAGVRVLLEPGAAPGPALERLTRGPLDEARAALAPHPLSTRVRMGVRSTRERRAR